MQIKMEGMMKIKLSLCFLLLATLIYPLSYAENSLEVEPILSTRIEISAGEDITITLPANPTTGYTWQLAKPLDKTILGESSSSYVPDRTQQVGSGGREIWTIKTLKPGRTKAIFNYLRPWEKETPPVKTITFIIIVK